MGLPADGANKCRLFSDDGGGIGIGGRGGYGGYGGHGDGLGAGGGGHIVKTRRR